MIPRTFQEIMEAIADKTISSDGVLQILITREAYLNIILDSEGTVSPINLPLMSINVINYTVSYFNFNPSFPFVLTDFTTANDWITYNYPL